MRKPSIAIVKATVRGEVRWCIRVPTLDGKRTRRFFTSRAEAETFRALKSAEVQSHGIRGVSLSEQDRAAYLWSVEQLRPYGLDVRAAVTMLLPQLKAREHGLTVEDAIVRLLESKRVTGVSGRHLVSLRNNLYRFAAAFPKRPLASFGHSNIEQYLHALPVGANSANHHRVSLSTLFRYACKLGACVTNPVSGIEHRKFNTPTPRILDAKQLRRLLAASADDPEMLAYFTVCAFAGLRSSEARRLDWKHVSLSRGIIEVTADNAKNARRRHAPICDALSAWLAPLAKASGPVAPVVNFRRREFAIRTAAGLADADWQRHALRHSAASYRLALVQDAGKVALELGHEPGILLGHYRELTTPEDAAAWFAVKPSAAANVVAMKAA